MTIFNSYVSLPEGNPTFAPFVVALLHRKLVVRQMQRRPQLMRRRRIAKLVEFLVG